MGESYSFYFFSSSIPILSFFFLVCSLVYHQRHKVCRLGPSLIWQIFSSKYHLHWSGVITSKAVSMAVRLDSTKNNTVNYGIKYLREHVLHIKIQLCKGATKTTFLGKKSQGTSNYVKRLVCKDKFLSFFNPL